MQFPVDPFTGPALTKHASINKCLGATMITENLIDRLHHQAALNFVGKVRLGLRHALIVVRPSRLLLPARRRACDCSCRVDCSAVLVAQNNSRADAPSSNALLGRGLGQRAQ